MKIDFTINLYKELIGILMDAGFSFQVYRDFVNQPKGKVVILRHDVDARKEHSLQFAKIQHEMGIAGTYYFRMVPQSFDEGVSPVRERVSEWERGSLLRRGFAGHGLDLMIQFKNFVG